MTGCLDFDLPTPQDVQDKCCWHGWCRSSSKNVPWKIPKNIMRFCRATIGKQYPTIVQAKELLQSRGPNLQTSLWCILQCMQPNALLLKLCKHAALNHTAVAPGLEHIWVFESVDQNGDRRKTPCVSLDIKNAHRCQGGCERRVNVRSCKPGGRICQHRLVDLADGNPFYAWNVGACSKPQCDAK